MPGPVGAVLGGRRGGGADVVTHELKCALRYFAAVLDGSKPFEVRRNDRGFKVGDELHIREYDTWVVGGRYVADDVSTSSVRWVEAHERGYTGRECRRVVTYVLAGPAFGIEAGFCVMGLALPPRAGRRGARR